MIDLLKLIIGALASLFRPRAKLEAENLVPAATDQCALLADVEATRYEQYHRFLFVWLYRSFHLRLGSDCDC
jgi:hypothetical protein